MAQTKFGTHPCPKCGIRSEVILEREDVLRWVRGEHIQDVWPQMTAGERELIMTGYHSTCFEEDFKDLE